MKIHLLAFMICGTSFAMHNEKNNSSNQYAHLTGTNPIFNKENYQYFQYMSLSPQEITEHTTDIIKTLSNFNLKELEQELSDASANFVAEKRKLEKDQNQKRLIELSTAYNMTIKKAFQAIENQQTN